MNNLTPMTLTPEQDSAVTCPGALMVTAGAGSGKTRVLAHRVAHLVNTEVCNPFNILVVTFSVRAARELRERLADLVESASAKLMMVCTLHALGLRMLRESGDMLGYELDDRHREPRVITPTESRRMVTAAAKTVCATPSAPVMTTGEKNNWSAR